MINIERSLTVTSRLEGHIVQGHVDEVGVCTKCITKDGNHLLYFAIQESNSTLIVPKGSICINGVSLTIIEVTKNIFSIGIIPHTLETTNLQTIKPGDQVNIEFDILGKYIAKLSSNYKLYNHQKN